MTTPTAAPAGQHLGMVLLGCGHTRTLPWDDARHAGKIGGRLHCEPHGMWYRIITHKELIEHGYCTVCLKQWARSPRGDRILCDCNRDRQYLAELLEQVRHNRGPNDDDPFDFDLWADEARQAIDRMWPDGKQVQL